MADNAVFARSVEPLKHNKQRMLPFGVRQVLQLRHFLDVLLNLGQSLFAGFMFPVVIGIEMFEPNLGSRFYDEFFQVIRHVSVSSLSGWLSPTCQSNPQWLEERSFP